VTFALSALLWLRRFVGSLLCDHLDTVCLLDMRARVWRTWCRKCQAHEPEVMAYERGMRQPRHYEPNRRGDGSQ
jgi:hypothetical protein